MRGYNDLSKWEQSNLHDPKTGLLYQNTGLDAPKSVDEIQQKYQEHVSSIAATMTNPDQQRQFANIAAHHQSQMDEQLGRYEHEQVITAHNQTAVDRVALNASRARCRITANPTAAVRAPERHPLGHRRPGKWNQWSPERVQLEQDHAVSSTNMEILRQLTASGQDRQAQAWYDAHKDELKGGDLPTATGMVENGSTAGTALRSLPKYTQDAAGEPLAWSATVDRIYADKTLQADPKQFAATIEAAQRYHADRDQGIKEDQEKLKQQAVGILDHPGSLGVNDPTYQAMRMRLEPTTRAQMDALGSPGKEAKDNPAFVNDIYSRLSTPKGQQSLKDVDIVGAVGRGDLTLKTAQELAGDNFKGGIIGAAINGEGAGNPKIASIMTQQEVLKEAFTQQGVDEAKNPAGANDIREELAGWTQSQETQGRKVTLTTCASTSRTTASSRCPSQAPSATPTPLPPW